jgi:dTDP-4-dehydrorhamnose reductase
MTVLVVGDSGQLASHLKTELPDATYRGRESLDLANPAAVGDAVEAAHPSAIVVAAAYTAVDKAESERALAWLVNVEAVAAIARTAAALDVPLLHISTDYVFDGRREGAYVVDDPVRPLNVYGVTKLAGELAVQALCMKHWLLRTSWVFSEHGTNFVKTMLRAAQGRQTLKVVADQRGRPTYAGDLARLIAEILRRRGTGGALAYGTYHAVGGPAVSWHDFALAIFAAAQRHGLLRERPVVRPIPTAEYPTAARRPMNSVLAPSVELDALGVSFDWTRALDQVVEKLALGQ